MNWDVVIIGAGPAGLFAAYELANESSLKIAIIDKGKDINERKCPSITNYTICMECKPCNILCGLGGAGGLSEGSRRAGYLGVPHDESAVGQPRSDPLAAGAADGSPRFRCGFLVRIRPVGAEG